MSFQARAIRSLVVLVLPAVASVAEANVAGKVVDVRTGRGIAQAGIVLEMDHSVAGATALTVFTGADGRFRIDTSAVPGQQSARLAVHKLGMRQKSPSDKPIPVTIGGNGPAVAIDLAMEPASNIADQVPASAWLDKAADSDSKHEVLLHCSGCHQFPSAKVIDYARKIEAAPQPGGGSAQKAASWHHQVRKESWRAAVKYMRAKSYEIFPDNTTIDVTKIDWDTIQAPEYSLFTVKDEEVISNYLSDALPKQFDYLAPDQYDYGAPLGVTDRTVIREYQLPDASLVREATVVPGSTAIWGADIQKNRLMKLEPGDGSIQWFDVPFKTGTGPHTILGDDEGNVWLSLLESDQLARFAPKTQEWRLYSLRPSDMDAKNFLGGQAMVHDISFGEEYRLKKDAKGLIWLTLIGSNKIGSLDPVTGEVHHYAAPEVDGRQALNISLYSLLLSRDGSCVWFTQLMGYFGCFNTLTHKIEGLVKPPSGSGPRRLSVDDEDNLWVPYYGSGQLAKYDTRARKIAAVFNLPDRAAAPYASTWDSRRKVIWLANSNADVIYQFNPSTKKFLVFPTPRAMGYLRKITVDPATGDLVSSYSNIPAGSGPSMAVSIHVGDAP